MNSHVHIQRLNFTPSEAVERQKAAVATDVLPWLEKEAKERQREHGKTAPGRKKTLTPKKEEVFGESAEQAGKLLGVSRSYVADAFKESPFAPNEQVRLRGRSGNL